MQCARLPRPRFLQASALRASRNQVQTRRLMTKLSGRGLFCRYDLGQPSHVYNPRRHRRLDDDQPCAAQRLHSLGGRGLAPQAPPGGPAHHGADTDPAIHPALAAIELRLKRHCQRDRAETGAVRLHLDVAIIVIETPCECEIAFESHFHVWRERAARRGWRLRNHICGRLCHAAGFERVELARYLVQPSRPMGPTALFYTIITSLSRQRNPARISAAISRRKWRAQANARHRSVPFGSSAA